LDNKPLPNPCPQQTLNKMITKQEIEHFKSIGMNEIVLDENKNPNTRYEEFICPKYLLNIKERKLYLIDKSIIKN
jgi:hypothetical protein